MKKYALSAIGVLAAATAATGVGGQAVTASATPNKAAAAPGPVGVAGTWTPSFSDEFAKTSLDKTKWRTGWFGAQGAVTGTPGANPPNPNDPYRSVGCLDPANLSYSGSTVRILTIRKSQVCDSSGQPRPYSGAMISTNSDFLNGNSAPKYQFAYGFAEARIYLSGANGKVPNWPAFWLTAQNNWPTTGEIDIAEGGEGGVAHNFHYGTPANPQQVGGDVPGDWTGQGTGYHTFGVDWEPGSLTFYYDGKKVASTPSNPNPVTSGVTGDAQYIILSNSPGAQSYKLVPAGMYIDYVRVWCKGTTTSCRK